MFLEQDDDPERGYTLVELIVYSSLLIIVVAVVAGLFVSGLTATERVQTVTAATTSGQVVADSIETNVRNSTDFLLTTPAGTDQFLVARTVNRDSTLSWHCVAWYYSAAGNGSIYSKRSSVAILLPTPIELQDWTLVQEGIAPVAGTNIFSASGQQLTVNFASLAGDHPSVVISSSATSRAGASGGLTCF
ncbi:hypothetical protein E3O45_07460 [Cryobacterium sp. TMS1-20-1]|uniref:PulJ/GspJ family protein n=1 Tax=Cryobacterium sp. TMS1-20-1 TaxID=1259223 RepID=UPI001069BE97|nr:hypothetical protein [Cryobacterium sp. TMS1-20-1]TFC77195.1 hypothetical protein E3O45_07460 [Cryobacterium sp. TMS1-20-1]